MAGPGDAMQQPVGGAGRQWVRGPQDVVAGLVVIAIAAVILRTLSLITTTSYSTFSPALFPRICTYCIMLGGVVLVARGLVKHGPGLERLPLRPLALVVLAVAGFGFIAPLFGYAIAGLLTLIVSGLAAPDLRLRQLLVVSILLIAASVALFSYALKLTMPIVMIPGLSF
ncbi:tripartite tricarboxylate transporter TctB family protein [Chelatococcus asaccharovorans]|uniref:tripartite tricarboxylate transporter TctB family protein n=2 Tax=Chelatococcus asaccharovorans TaxID=28210 RepID=UPI00224C6704|nr:tripartite tricarboxylate transporter TctB family protein [Chelatococcus asaccharovorans]CAH1651650.1 Tripartite tricarboxylate transporter TctB family protein [Chelatococcus asaccharovorans]CAH1693040.1 Tripartite tricarboxylate transporter TctB family protein [Chelatococcus asaccharovorans]